MLYTLLHHYSTYGNPDIIHHCMRNTGEAEAMTKTRKPCSRGSHSKKSAVKKSAVKRQQKKNAVKKCRKPVKNAGRQWTKSKKQTSQRGLFQLFATERADCSRLKTLTAPGHIRRRNCIPTEPGLTKLNWHLSIVDFVLHPVWEQNC